MTDVNAIKSALKQGKVTIEFTKMNGHRRVMVATLNETLLPPPHPEKSNTTRDPNLLIVFDTQHAGWRTVKVDSIISWSPGESDTAAPAPIVPTPTPVVPEGWSPKVTPAA